MRSKEIKNSEQTLFRRLQSIDLETLMMDAVDYIDDDLFVELLEASDYTADVSPETPQLGLQDNMASLQTDDFENHLSVEDTSTISINSRSLDRLMMDAVDYIDDDLFVDLLEESYKPLEESTKENNIEYTAMPDNVGKWAIFENVKEFISLVRKTRVIGICPLAKASSNMELISSIKEEGASSLFNCVALYEGLCSTVKEWEEGCHRYYKKMEMDVLLDSRESLKHCTSWNNTNMGTFLKTYFMEVINEDRNNSVCTPLLLEDKFEKAFDIPLNIPWKKKFAQCDGNSYLINSYMGKAYIQINAIMNSFICVPQKAHNKFNMAKLIVNNENINSITVPSTIGIIYMVVNCCEELIDISFMDFTFKKNSKPLNVFWIEITNCEKLKYIRFPTSTYSISKLLIKDCKSLESIYFPGEVAEQNNNIFLDHLSCPQVSIVSDDDSMREYAEETNIPIRSIAIG